MARKTGSWSKERREAWLKARYPEKYGNKADTSNLIRNEPIAGIVEAVEEVKAAIE